MKQEADNGKTLQKIDKANDKKGIQAYDFNVILPNQVKQAGGDEKPDNVIRGLPAGKRDKPRIHDSGFKQIIFGEKKIGPNYQPG